MQLDQLHRVHENPACALFEYRGSVMVTGLLHRWKGVCSTDHPHGLHLQTMWCCLLQIGFSLAPLLPSAWKDMAAWVRVFSFSFVVQVCEYSEIIFETLYSDLLNGASLILHGVSADDGFWKWYTLWSASSRKFFVLAYAVIREKV